MNEYVPLPEDPSQSALASTPNNGPGAPAYVPAYAKGLVSLTGAELLMRPFPPRENILAPWLPTQGLAMVYAERGIGKTWVGLNVAYAIASGGSYLEWTAPKPRKVVYIDGEMPGSLLQERFRIVAASSDHDAPEDGFRLVAADLQADGLPDLSDVNAQRFYDAEIRDADLIIVDNLSTIARGSRENEADGWTPVQAWMLAQRAAGRSVLLIHHAGKGGGQRGTSKREDVLDTVINLRRPVDYEPAHGARFEVHYEKARGIYGDAVTPFEAHLIEGKWRTAPIVVVADDETLRKLQGQGLSIRDIEKRTGLSKSKVQRRLKGGE